MGSSRPFVWNGASQDTAARQNLASPSGNTNGPYPSARPNSVGNAVTYAINAGASTALGYEPGYHSVLPPLPNQTPAFIPPFHQQVGGPYNLGPTPANQPPPQIQQSVLSGHSQLLHSIDAHGGGQPPPYVQNHTRQQFPAPHPQSFLQQPRVQNPTPNLSGTTAMQGGMVRPPTAPAPLTKNAIMLLNEASQKHKLGTPIYNFLTLPADTAHTVALELCQHTFIGTGASRAAAKNVAAEKALGQLHDLKRNAPLQDPPPPMNVEKDPVSALNEVCQKRSLTALYTFSTAASGQWKGPAHSAKLGIAGRFFVASAPRKDVAKKLVAKAALDHLQGFSVGRPTATSPITPTASTQTAGPRLTPQETAACAQALLTTTGGPSPVGTQISQNSAIHGATQKQGGQAESTSEAAATVVSSEVAAPAKRDYSSVMGTAQDPLSLLNKHAALQGTPLGVTVQAVASGFAAACAVNGQTFSAEGTSKRAAKRGMADQVLIHLEAQQPGTLESLRGRRSKKRARKLEEGGATAGSSGAGGNGDAAHEENGPTQKKQKQWEHRVWVEKGKGDGNAFAYTLAGVVGSRYRQLARATNTQPKKKVFAAFVLERPSPTGKFLVSVVAIGTGRHTAPLPIPGDTILRDCRPEVLACRAFRRFLCTKLERELQGKPSEEPSMGGGKPGVESAVKKQGIGVECLLPDEEAAGAATATETRRSDGEPSAPKKVKFEAGTEDPRQAGPSQVKTEADGSTVRGERDLKPVKVAASEEKPGVDAATEKVGAERAEETAATGQPGAGPGVDAEVDVTANVDDEAAQSEGSPGAVGDEALFCQEEGRRQWRLCDDVKVHLWVSLPMADGNPREEAERQSLQDKIRRWSAVGVQGSVLSHLLSPVYVSIITANCNRGLYRAAVEGFEGTELLRPPFSVHPPTVVHAGCMVKPWTFPVGKGAEMAADAENWALGDEGLETVKTADGRAEGGESRLSRRQMFEQFRRLQDASKGDGNAEGFADWQAAKEAAVGYREAKEMLARCLAQQEKQGEGSPSSDDKSHVQRVSTESTHPEEPVADKPL